LLGQYHILLVVHQRTVENQLRPGLRAHYDITTVHSRRAAMQGLAEKPTVLLLIHVPSLRFDLPRFCQDVRSQFPNIPRFFLLGKGMRLDQVPRADAHLRQPFTIRQVLRRLNRTLPAHAGKTVAWQDLILDTQRHLLRWDNKQVLLTPKQATSTLAFLSNPERILSCVYLMQKVWGTDFLGDARTLDVHIHWFRKALKQLQAPFTLTTLRRQGYKSLKCDSMWDAPTAYATSANSATLDDVWS